MRNFNTGRLEFWIRERSEWLGSYPAGTGMYEVRYGSHLLASFVRKELAAAYRDWCWARRNVYLSDTRLGRYTLEELIKARTKTITIRSG